MPTISYRRIVPAGNLTAVRKVFNRVREDFDLWGEHILDGTDCHCKEDAEPHHHVDISVSVEKATQKKAKK